MTMEGLDAFKDEGKGHEEDRRIFNRLNGYTEKMALICLSGEKYLKILLIS